MVAMTIRYASLPGTEAAVGTAGGHTLVADRPSGIAGGQGLGFNGGQLLALALGGCFCNDVRYCTHDMELEVARLEVEVTLDLDGDPLVATTAHMRVDCSLADGVDPTALLDRAKARCTVAHSLRAGLEVEIT